MLHAAIIAATLHAQGPLTSEGWNDEALAVIGHLVEALPAEYQASVEGIPVINDTSVFEVNAYAGCGSDDKPFMAFTTGLAYVLQGIAMTQAADEYYGGHHYEAFLNSGTVFLDETLLPPGSDYDDDMLERAHQIWDDAFAFTLGHELAHHYLGHTTCAVPRPWVNPLDKLRSTHNTVISILPSIAQWQESQADAFGTINMLDAGYASSGATNLMTFFESFETHAGVSKVDSASMLKSHPRAEIRLGAIGDVVAKWQTRHGI